jgi:predicted transcriptional regulator
MSTENQAAGAEGLKQLREARKQTIAVATARMKAQKKESAAIKHELKQGGRTVPEIAAATGIPSDTVMWYLATLKKYGEIVESGQDGNYFRYQLSQAAPAETEPDEND